VVIDAYHSLESEYREVIKDICKRMGYGMAEFINKNEVTDIKDWNLYCHYVAGLVGIGLSRLFASSKLENPEFYTLEDLSNNMGLFLQKTNIIRDYLDDIDHKRIFWPKEIWSKYANSLQDFKKPENNTQAIFCLNHLITDALELIPDCLDYMSKLKDRQVFNFCAIPQIMAIATLALCYSNYGVFCGVVKIRRGLTAKLFELSTNMDALQYFFDEFLKEIEIKVLVDDPNRIKTLQTIKTIREKLPKDNKYYEFGTVDLLALATFTISGIYLAKNGGRMLAKL